MTIHDMVYIDHSWNLEQGSLDWKLMIEVLMINNLLDIEINHIELNFSIIIAKLNVHRVYIHTANKRSKE